MNKSKENASETCKQISRLGRRQILHIRDCAKALVDISHPFTDNGTEEPLSNDNFVSAYRDISSSLSFACGEKEYPEPEAEAYVNITGRSFGTASRALLCRYIWEFSQSSPHPLSAKDFFRSETTLTDLRIAYVKNSYSEVAYRAFSSVLPGCSVVYPGNFSAVCEEVYNNRAGFCILPYETSDEGALSGFRQLIIKYELVQIMSCSVSVEGTNGTRITRFALLSKGFSPQVLPKSAPKFLKIIIDNPHDGLLSDIYNAAELNGFRHVKSESIPIAWDTERYSCAITFSLGISDPSPFLLYLALEVPESTADSLFASL